MLESLMMNRFKILSVVNLDILVAFRKCGCQTSGICRRFQIPRRFIRQPRHPISVPELIQVRKLREVALWTRQALERVDRSCKRYQSTRGLSVDQFSGTGRFRIPGCASNPRMFIVANQLCRFMCTAPVAISPPTSTSRQLFVRDMALSAQDVVAGLSPTSCLSLQGISFYPFESLRVQVAAEP